MQKPSISPDPVLSVPKGKKPKAASITISNKVGGDGAKVITQTISIYLDGEADDGTFDYDVTIGVGDSQSTTLTVAAEDPSIANPLVGINNDFQFPFTDGDTVTGTVTWNDFPDGNDIPIFIPVNFETQQADLVIEIKKESFFRRLINAIIRFFS